MSDSRITEIKSKVKFDVLFREFYPNHYRSTRNSLCPWHDDHGESLELKGDHALCYGACAADGKTKSRDVIDLYKLKHDCGFKEARDALAARCGIKGKEKSKTDVVAVYDYQTGDGTVIFQVLRYSNKDFKQRRPDPSKSDKWIWNLKGIKPVLFRLPALTSAERIWIPEGEKDVLGLEKLGFAATCNPMGAGKWHKVCDAGNPPEVLRGKTVYILPDNDDAGRGHADQVARSLRGFASSVKIITLTGLPDKGDVSNFIEQHGPDEAKRMLLELAENTPEYQPTVESVEEENEDQNSDKKGRPNRFKILSQLLSETGIEYFHDQFQSPWACAEISGHHENLKIKSLRFRTYLSLLFYKATGEGVARETLQQIQDFCSAQALFDGTQRTLSCRAAWQEKTILIDLGTPDWMAIEVTPEGWQIIQPERPPFRRFSHMKALPEPQHGGSIRDILRILPIQDEISQTLVCVWLPTVLIPDLPRPGIILAGLQGSGKTFTSERLRELVDPSEHLTQSLSRDHTELVQSLDHNYLPCFDNLTSLPLWASDTLCRAVTGGGYSKRELYSDDDDVCYSFFRPFIANGISNCASRPDLLDRVLICELARIAKEDRKPLKRLLSEFRYLQPKVLGAMLDALAGAMPIKDTVQLDGLHRLADWQEWAVAVAEVTGIGQDSFLSALERNVERQHSEVNSQDPTAVCVLQFMEGNPTWSGTPSELYTKLCEIAETMKLDREQAWPKAPNALTRKLKAVSHNLAAAGIEVTGPIQVGHDRNKKIVLRRGAQEPTGYPEIPSASKHGTQPNNVNELPRTIPADDIEMDQYHNTVRNTAHDNQLGLLEQTDADYADDISGNSDACDAEEYAFRLETWGCSDGCGYFQATAGFIRCRFGTEPLDLTIPEIQCPKFTPDGQRIPDSELPFALTEGI